MNIARSFGKQQAVLREPSCQTVLRSRYARSVGRYSKVLLRTLRDEHPKGFIIYNKSRNTLNISDECFYTVHRDLSEGKTKRAIAYQFEDKCFVRYNDGIKQAGNAAGEKRGESYYLDFLSCVLNPTFPNIGNSKFVEYCKNSMNALDLSQVQNLETAKSFTFLNLGVSGFESWGTLMIEAFGDDQSSAPEVMKIFFREEDDEREDTSTLRKIKGIVSALKKVDDEYNDALNKARIRKEAVKSAKAAIMSRNMSHNLGSHVMSYIKQNLSSVNNMIHDNVLSQLFQNEEEFKQFFTYIKNNCANEALAESVQRFKDINESDEIALPFFVGLGQFISYLQERQDFIATIATDYVPYYSTVNFKDFIYDELNPDKRYERHKDDRRTSSMKLDTEIPDHL